MSLAHCYAQSYSEARAKFLERCARAGAVVSHHQNPCRGPAGERVFMDVARLGPESPRRALLVMSGTHGVEGFCGSAIQSASLDAGLYRDLPPDTGVVLIHGINPYGFAWESRTNEDLVDICRNFVNFDRGVPQNRVYRELAPLLVPTEWEGAHRAAADRALSEYFEAHGERSALSDIAIGQYEFWNATFYGGVAHTWSTRQFLALLTQLFARTESLACVDYHSGLGPYGYGEMLVFHKSGSSGAQRSAQWWPGRAKIVKAGESSAYDLKGGILDGLEEALPHTAVTAGALEFGTLPIRDMLDALRADHWLRCYAEPDTPRVRDLRRQVRDAFYCDEPGWKDMVASQGMEVQSQALRGLADG